MNILVGKRDVTCLLINAICMKMLLQHPQVMASVQGSAAWIGGIYATLLALLFFYITDKLYSTNLNILTLSEKLGGKLFRIIIGVLMVGVLGIKMSNIVRLYSESVRIILLQSTSMEIVVILFAITVCIGAYFGLEAIARITSLFLPIMAGIIILFALLLIPFLDPSNLLPIFGRGSKHIFGTGFRFGGSIFSDLLLLNYLIPNCKDKKTAFQSGYRSIIISGVVVTIINLLYGMVYPYPASKGFIMPMYQLTRVVHIGDFLTRFDAFFEFIWSISAVLYGAIYLYVICCIWRDIFGLKYYQPLLFPVMVVVIVVGFIPESIVDIIRSYSKITSEVVYILAFVLPALLGGLYRIKDRKQERGMVE